MEYRILKDSILENFRNNSDDSYLKEEFDDLKGSFMYYLKSAIEIINSDSNETLFINDSHEANITKALQNISNSKNAEIDWAQEIKRQNNNASRD